MFKTFDSKEEEENIEEEYDSSYEINNWDDLDLNVDLLRGIYAYGFEKPSPIQCKAIKPIMLNKDIDVIGFCKLPCITNWL